MGRMHPTRPASGVPLVALVVALALASTAPAAADDAATERPPEEAEEAAPLPDGQWFGTASAEGSMGAQVEGMNADGRLNIGGPIEVETVDGAASGQAQMPGTGQIVFTGEMHAILDFDIDAQASVSGDASQLTLDGTHTTRLDMQITSPVSTSRSIGPNQHQLSPFTAEITGYDCHRAFADFSADLTSEATQGGWQTTDLRGLIDLQQVGPEIDTGLRDEAEQLVADYNEWSDEVRGGVHSDEQDPSTALTGHLRERINDLVNRAVDLELEMRGLDDDEQCVFGADLGGYSFLLTAMVQNLAEFVLNAHAGLTAEDLAALTDILLAMGGAGEGAARPDKAGELEALLAERGSELLEQKLVADESQSNRTGEPCTADAPCLEPSDEVVEVLLAAQRLGLTLEVSGEEITPSEGADLLTRIEE